MLVSVVIPVFYEESMLPGVLARLVDLRTRVDIEILLVVDVPDPSREDEVRSRNDALASRFQCVTLYRIGERGFGSALRKGFENTSGEIIVPMMGDGSDAPEDIPEFVRKIEQGWDVVGGSRYMREGRIVGRSLKQVVSRAYSLASLALGGPPILDVSNAFKAYRKLVLMDIDSVSESFDISVELTVKAFAQGYAITQIPTVWTNRAEGRSQFFFWHETSNYWRWLVYVVLARWAPRRQKPFSSNSKESRDVS